MKIIIAPDSFKDALSSLEVGKAIEAGIRLADPEIETEVFPLADGGEGSSEILGYHFGAEEKRVVVEDALGRPVEAFYYYDPQKKTALIEMAQASGIQRIGIHERNCMRAGSFGTGQLIRDAIETGAKKILLAVGGSATNDAGMGMASALGFKFFDAENNLLKGSGQDLLLFHHFDKKESIVPNDLSVEVICDVDNPLYGEKGAAKVYGKQKGANEAEIEALDQGLINFERVVRNTKKLNFVNVPGSGAAGGLGAGCMAFLNASLHKGIDFVLDLTEFEIHLKDIDLIITGEGKIDKQTLQGKLIQGVSRCAKRYSIPVIAVCGALELDPGDIEELSVKATFPIRTKPGKIEEALKNTRHDLTHLAFQIMKRIISDKNQ